MPTPMSGNPMMQSGVSPNLSSQVLSMGQPPDPSAEKSAPVVSPAEKLINSFGSVASDLKTLSSEYPNASAEYNEVVKALKNWLAKASDGISSGSGGESATY